MITKSCKRRRFHINNTKTESTLTYTGHVHEPLVYNNFATTEHCSLTLNITLRTIATQLMPIKTTEQKYVKAQTKKQHVVESAFHANNPLMNRLVVAATYTSSIILKEKEFLLLRHA